MNRSELLTAAQDAVAHRPRSYGSPERNFTRIARHWNVYLTGKYGAGRAPLLEAVDVAAMMALMKIARLEETPDHIDSWVDLAGYAACGAECATVIEHDPDERLERDLADQEPSPPIPRFKVGDKVKVRGRDAIGEVTSIDADDESLPYEVRFPNETCSDWPYPSDMRLAATPPRFKVGDEVIFTELPNYKFTVHRISSDGSYSIRARHGSVFHDYDESELTPA